MSEELQSVALIKDTSAVVGNQRLSQATSLVQYTSKGNLLLIGDADRAFALLGDIKLPSVTIVDINDDYSGLQKKLSDQGVALFTTPSLQLEGHLGAFRATVPDNNIRGSESPGVDFDIGVSVFLETGQFDLVLDLSQTAVVSAPQPPFGYRHAVGEEAIGLAIAELSDLIGEFEKPRYFNYNDSICAHSRSELPGCTRCVDVCTTNAIASIGDAVSVDPYLCQGCGSCAVVCPSGAMSYAFPRVADAIERSRRALEDASACVLLLHTESHQVAVDKLELNSEIVPLLVEEISAFGPDYWLAMLAGQACRIVLVSDASDDDPTLQAVNSQIRLVAELLCGLGIDEPVISVISSKDLTSDESGVLQESDYKSSKLNTLVPTDFATRENTKRQTMRMALDSLSEAFLPEKPAVALSSSAPFGRVTVDKTACTLCMACVATCPAGALLDGQDLPALRFVEANCLQCGLCDQACPESAITLEARYTWDSLESRRMTTLHEEEPFHCLNCHVPFTTKSMIETMSSKLAGHWMFQENKALRRLQLCGDCRVKDIFENDSAGIDVHNPKA